MWRQLGLPSRIGAVAKRQRLPASPFSQHHHPKHQGQRASLSVVSATFSPPYQSCRAAGLLFHRSLATSARARGAATSLSKKGKHIDNSSSSNDKNTLRIKSRPDGEAEVESKFSLPDKDKELELVAVQNEIQDRYKAGNYPSALKLSRELQTKTESHFGLDHPATASAYNNVGLMHKLLGNFDDSRRAYEMARKVYKRVLGSDHASYASTLHNLGNLNRTQIHFDANLRATDRLSLVEQALEYLQRAYRIRVEELGPHHPHTVASRSSWGATLAAQILHYHKMTTKHTSNNGETSTSQLPYYISVLPADVSTQAWEAAHEHLKEALDTAIANPRGPSLPQKKNKKTRHGSKQQRTKKASTTSTTPNLSSLSELPLSLQTLSAASAAQNLAVFCKARATTTTPYDQALLSQAHELYKQTLHVRSQLLPSTHPDLYATQFSLAELLQAMGDEEAANTLRQAIVDTYDPPSNDSSDDHTSGDGADNAPDVDSKRL